MGEQRVGVFIDSTDALDQSDCDGNGTDAGTMDCDTYFDDLITYAHDQGATDVEMNLGEPCDYSDIETAVEADGPGVIWQVGDYSESTFESVYGRPLSCPEGFSWIPTFIAAGHAKRWAFAVNVSDPNCAVTSMPPGCSSSPDYTAEMSTDVSDAYDSDIGHMSFTGAANYYGTYDGMSDGSGIQDDFNNANATFNCDIRALAISDPGSSC